MFPQVIAGPVRRLVVSLIVTLGATVGFIHVYALPVRWNIGPSARWWRRVRRLASAIAGEWFDERAAPRPVTEGEYAGMTAGPLEEVEELLWRNGFVRNPFSRLKTRGSQLEAGSWAYRESALANRQLHVMLFTRDDGDVDVYAHEEPSSVNPLAGARHFRGEGQDVAAGVASAVERLPLDTSERTVDPVSGPWNVQEAD